MEPERNIEKLLRNFAKKRGEQAGAPLELDPVARRQLQEEVARRARKPPEENFFLTFLAAVRSRLAFTLCLLVVFIAGGWLLLPTLSRSKSKGSSRMAMGNLSKAMEERDSGLPATPPAVDMAEAKKNASSNERADSDLSRARQETPKLEIANADVKQANEPATPVPPTGSTTATAGEKEKRLIADAVSFADARTSGVTIASSAVVPDQPLASAQTSPTAARRQARPAAESNLFGGGGGGGGGAGGNLVRFHRIPDPVAPASVGVPPLSGFIGSETVSQNASSTVSNLALLSSFAIEQSGGALRIVDRDGSVYTGSVELAESPPPVRAPVPERSKVDAALTTSREGTDRARQYGAETGQRWSFRVSGTNVSLKQNIVFSGDLFVRTNETVLNQPVVETTTGGTVDSVAIVPQLGLGNSRIRGTALIGDMRAVEIRAEPAR